MVHELLPLDATERVTPRSLQGYAQGLGWVPVPNTKRSEIAIFHRPDSQLHQVVVPMDESLDDYGEAVAVAIRKLAAFERRPARELLDVLLLPPADLLQFREISPDAELGSLPFDRAVQMLNGTKRLLLSVAHSILFPQRYHPRLSRQEAEEFVNRCRLCQTERGSFVINIACPLEPQLAIAGLNPEPFARQVTRSLIHSLDTLAKAEVATVAEELLDPVKHPGMSANLCESLLLLRPHGDRATLTVSASWSRSFLPPPSEAIHHVQLRQNSFDLAEQLANRLRTVPEPRPGQFIGFVDGLRGEPTGQDPRPSGEVDFTIFETESDDSHARGWLGPDDYALAAEAHLHSSPVWFRGVLYRLPRMRRILSITDFEILRYRDDHSSNSKTTNLAKDAGRSAPVEESSELPF